jgi:hypothetical protein
MAQQNVHKELTEFLSKNPAATHKELLDFGDDLTKRLINKGEFDAVVGTHDALLEALNARSAASRKLIEESLHRTRSAGAAAATSTKAAMSSFSLPKGVSAGKATAIVAGVGLLAAGAYALMRKKDEPSAEAPAQPAATSWVDRVQQQRMREQGAARSV